MNAPHDCFIGKSSTEIGALISSFTYEFPRLQDLTKNNIDKVFQGFAYVEHKLDGEALIVFKGHAYGRRISSVSFKRENKWAQLPPSIQAQAIDHPVLGELHIPGFDSSVVKTALVDGRVNGWQESKLRFTAHTCLAFSSASTADQRAFLKDKGFEIPRLYGPEEDAIYLSGLTDFNMWTREATELGIEGFVFKFPSRRWFKLKAASTIDCFITGTKPGAGKFKGLVGALICSVYKGNEVLEIASVSGMTDDVRRSMTEDPDLIGKIVEVEFNGYAARGRLKHPRFVRFREDKNKEDCKWLSE